MGMYLILLASLSFIQVWKVVATSIFSTQVSLTHLFIICSWVHFVFQFILDFFVLTRLLFSLFNLKHSFTYSVVKESVVTRSEKQFAFLKDTKIFEK